jgi:hypothetical protein
MKNNPLFFTASMAKLCADQGYVEQSLAIYQYLLKSDPENQALREAMAGVEARSAAAAGAPSSGEEKPEGLEPMIQKWVSLLVEHDLKSKFDKIRNSIKKLQRPENKS